MTYLLDLEANLSFTMEPALSGSGPLSWPTPVVISSGYRCPELNAAVGGSKTSQHMKAQAIDFTCPGFGDPSEDRRETDAHADSPGDRPADRPGTRMGPCKLFRSHPGTQVLRLLGNGEYETLGLRVKLFRVWNFNRPEAASDPAEGLQAPQLTS